MTQQGVGQSINRGVAQPGSVHAWGACGRRFKSSRPDQFLIFFFLLFFCFFSSVYASSQNCDKAVFVGDMSWVPYTMASNYELVGVSVDIADIIFKELDIPYTTLNLEDQRSLKHALELGDVDLVLGMYAAEQQYPYLKIIHPSYAIDPLTILVRDDDTVNLSSWDDLIGQRGALALRFEVDDQFNEYISKYLFVQHESNLANLMNMINLKKIDYILGSYNQLDHLLDNKNFRVPVMVHEEIKKVAHVHMAMSKRSACIAYAPYIAKRLKELKTDGTLAEILAKYQY